MEIKLSELDIEILKIFAELGACSAGDIQDELVARGWPVMSDGSLAPSRGDIAH